jgi:SAM-dependent methyltransferase
MLKIYASHGAEKTHWKRLWNSQEIKKLNKVDKKEKLAKILLKNIPSGSKVLEAGCGLGRWVVFLNGNDYDAIGVDFEKSAIEKIIKIYSGMDFRAMDVKNLDFPSSVFDAYVSFGVMEHSEEGPERILSEARRVLKDNGTMILTVPFANLLSRILHRNENEDGYFYEYMFTKSEIIGILENSGFEVLDVDYYDNANITRASKTLNALRKRESPFFRWSKSFARRALNALPHYFLSHMIIIVARKKTTS